VTKTLPDKVVILGKLPEDATAHSFEVLTFVKDGLKYIPLFSTAEKFKRLTEGTEYQHQGIEIDTRLLGALLTDDVPIILDPKSSGSRLVNRNELLGLGTPK
jgi:hypothetical protein